MPPALLVVNVSLTGSDRDYDEQVTFLDRPFRLLRIGTDGDVDAAEEARPHLGCRCRRDRGHRHPRGPSRRALRR